MSQSRVNIVQWTCSWCGTLNPTLARGCDEGCLSCRRLRSTGDWAKSETIINDDFIQKAYLEGQYRDIAESVVNKRILNVESRLVRDALKLALAAELATLDTYLDFLEIGQQDGSGLGWVWPKASFVSGVTLHLERDGIKRRQSVDRRGPKHKAVNLIFKKTLNRADTRIGLSLFYRGHRRIETRPKEMKFNGETT